MILSDMERDEGIILRCVPSRMLVVADVDRDEFTFLMRLEDSSASASSALAADNIQWDIIFLVCQKFSFLYSKSMFQIREHFTLRIDTCVDFPCLEKPCLFL